MARAWRMLMPRSPTHDEKQNMKIHSTPHACYVSLNNGLTLELTFDTVPARRWTPEAEFTDTPASHRCSGVWLFGEEVLFEVRVGQA